MKALVTAVIGLVIAVDCFASQDRIASWNSIEVQTSKSDRDIRVSASANEEGLQKLSMSVDGKTLLVPPSEFADLKKVRLNSLRILFGRYGEYSGLDGVAYQYVSIEFGEPHKTTSGWDYDTADFMFFSGRYQKRTVNRLSSPGQWSVEEKDPGTPSKAKGKISQLK